MAVRCAAAVIFGALVALCALSYRGVDANDRQYLNEWAVEIPGGPDAARSIANELGYELIRQVGDLSKTPKLSRAELKPLG